MISMCRRVLEGLVKRGILPIIRIWLLELRERHVMDKYSAIIWVYFGHIQWMFFGYIQCHILGRVLLL